ncbi:MAG TPA: hypothetical protein PLX06_12350 [Fimbriimonadaceae bacterium]|nr:hypothetical protein [Fimbriimonadaceae bacterium]
MSAANIRETKIGLGIKYQSALHTALAAADCISLTKTNASLSNVDLRTEDDAMDIGKGDEWPTQQFLTNWEVSGTIEKYLSSEFLAWLFCFGLGKTTKTSPETGAYLYTSVPQDPVTDGIDMKAFTFVEAIRQGGSPVIDRAAVGCVVNDFQISLKSGPGRANAMATVNFVGCGKIVSPSGITIPAVTQEHYLNAASAAITINGTNYVTEKSFVDLDMEYSNNVRMDSGFYPGSGTDNGGALRGRMEFGDRTLGLRFRARFKSGSTEITKLMAQTKGVATISLTGATIAGVVNHGMTITFPELGFASAIVQDAEGIVVIEVTGRPMKHSSNGILTAAATCAIDGILSAAS